MMIELDKCIGCFACVSVCKERWDIGPNAQRDWVYTYETGSREQDLAVTFYPGLCMQCEQHPCTLDCPTGATYMDQKTGVVMVDSDVCIGCGNCISNCPYGARTTDPKQQIVQKCNLCMPYVARGQMPACVATCLAECRHFGDLDDPDSEISKLNRTRNAQALKTKDIDVGPKITFSGDKERQIILQQNGVITPPKPSTLTKIWTRYTKPLVQVMVPPLFLVTLAGGMILNLRNRRRKHDASSTEIHPSQSVAPNEQIASSDPAQQTNTSEIQTATTAFSKTQADQEQVSADISSTVSSVESKADASELERHKFGVRLLHWFNALTWVVLTITGVALMTAKSFALFGTGFPQWFNGLFGGVANVIWFHVVWGIVWSCVTIPLFLLYKRGGLDVWKEVRLTRNDFLWILAKPKYMLGLSDKPLPPQDKYNAGQKLFAILVLITTSTIIATGFIMSFHIGGSQVVAASILIHKLAIALTLLGVAVHITMAAIIKEERPALRSMFTGKVSREHALSHNPQWVAEIEKQHKAIM
jgi:formate dehydrogenase gamma subunit